MEHLPIGVSILRQFPLTGRGMLLVHVESLSIGAGVCGGRFCVLDGWNRLWGIIHYYR